jgi:dTDP-glucose 4,6-dehydratase
MKFEPCNVLITGGAGFIGANFVRHWLQTSSTGQVVVFDALTYAGNVQNLFGLDSNPRYAFEKGDICDEGLVRQLLERYEIDTLIHFAAESHVDRSILGPDEFIRTNITGTHTLLKAAKARWLEQKTARAHRFHHVSTDEVYGSLGPYDAPFQESSPYAPNSPYSASKAASDHLVRAYHETYGLETTTTNCSNNYGPYQFPEKLIPLTIVHILRGEPLPVYGDGLQIRDWLHVADHCEAISLALSRGISGEVYNIGGSGETTNLEVVTSLCELVDHALTTQSKYQKIYPASPVFHGKRAVELIAHITDRQGHDRRYSINYSKATNSLGYAPSWALGDGLKATVAWYLEEAAWWDKSDLASEN